MKSASVLLALGSLIALAISLPRILPARASLNPDPKPVAASACVDRYNSLLRSAKAALIAGNRAATADLLGEAQRVIPMCPALHDGRSPRAPLFAMNTCDGTRWRESGNSDACVWGPTAASFCES